MFINPLLGVLKVTNTFSGRRPVYAIFRTKTLKDWYPLNINHDYKYSQKRGQFELVEDTRVTLEVDTYKDFKTRAMGQGTICERPDWLCPDIQKRNQFIIERGKAIKVVTFDDIDNLTEERLKGSYDNLYQCLNQFLDTIRQRFYEESYAKESLDKTTAFLESNSLDHEGESYSELKVGKATHVDRGSQVQLSKYYKVITQAEKEAYATLGEILVMVNLLSNIHRASKRGTLFTGVTDSKFVQPEEWPTLEEKITNEILNADIIPH